MFSDDKRQGAAAIGVSDVFAIGAHQEKASATLPRFVVGGQRGWNQVRVETVAFILNGHFQISVNLFGPQMDPFIRVLLVSVHDGIGHCLRQAEHERILRIFVQFSGMREFIHDVADLIQAPEVGDEFGVDKQRYSVWLVYEI